MDGLCSTHGGDEKCILKCSGILEDKKLLGRSRHRRVNHINTNLD
jgi:hypothetical protein